MHLAFCERFPENILVSFTSPLYITSPFLQLLMGTDGVMIIDDQTVHLQHFSEESVLSWNQSSVLRPCLELNAKCKQGKIKTCVSCFRK